MAISKKHRKITLAVLFTLVAALTFAQPAEEEADSQSLQQAENAQSAEEEAAAAHTPWDFFFTLGPSLYVNTDSESAPSPVKFSAGFGADFFNDGVLNFQPKVSVFTNYYLWDGTYARPAEVENRTALALSFLVDLDTTHTWKFSKEYLQVGGGISFLARYAFLASGVSADDTGTDTTAGNDIDSINSWFYKDLNYLYPNISVCYMHEFTENYLAGLETKIYIPLGALADGRALDTLIAFFGIKICIR